ncbi:MAG TPA: hypothetical protein DEP38_02600 [Cyanobacteria bacterium UBA9226]|nr:hypothetical protein [Cyanobacteria bacterium UBA9226]
MNNPKVIFWLSLSLTFSGIYSYLALREGFSNPYIVQDDARQHVFWMERFLDSELFPNDLIADYFQSVAPLGYASLYRIGTILGINPFIFNKILPSLLGAIATFYCFRISLAIFPIPIAGFMAATILNQSLWMKDDLISATPRGFVYPIFLAFIYYVLRRQLLPCLVAIALLGLFYTQYIFIAAGMLILRLLNLLLQSLKPLPNPSLPGEGVEIFHRQNYLFYLLGLAVSGIVLLFYAINPADFGPVISPSEAKTLPEFWGNGRSAFFGDNLWNFFLIGQRSGLLNVGLVRPATLTLALLLPILLRFCDPEGESSYRFPLVRQIQPSIKILPQILVVSLAMFVAAHLLLFKLHLPSRYTEHSWRIIFAIASGIVLTILLDAILRIGNRGARVVSGEMRRKIRNYSSFPLWQLPYQLLSVILTALIASLILFYPALVDDFPLTKYKEGHFPTLYHFFESQPKDSLISSVAEEANNIPTFAQRSILVGREYAIPYHLGYYRQFRQRIIELIQAQYTPDMTELKDFIRKFGIDFWLLEENSFTPQYLAQNQWLQPYQPAILEAEKNIAQGIIPALSKVVNDCSVFNREGFIVLKSTCILEKR